jgi:hypothetical protein
MELLKFKSGNSKLKGIFLFDLPAGHTCPFANNCLSKADRETGKLTDGEEIIFRCFSASQENYLPNLRNKRWYNYDLIKKVKTKNELITLLELSLPTRLGIIRIHESGDFFNQVYFDAWLQVARNNPQIIFYAYTKSIPFWVRRLTELPSNFRLTASVGGKKDKLIDDYRLKYAKVVANEEEAKQLGLEIDHTDFLAYGQDKSFALVVHGRQPKGSQMGKESYKNMKKGLGYSRKKKDKTK